MRSRAEQSETTRDRIIARAALLFVRKGYAAASIAELASAVGMTKGAIYHHFESKEAILLRVVEMIRSTWSHAVAREVLGARDSLDRLGTLLDSQAVFLQKNEAFCLLLTGLMTELEGAHPDLLKAVQAVYNELVHFIEQIVRKGQESGQLRKDLDAGLTALTIVGMLRGTACSRPLSERRAIDYSTILANLKSVLLSGLRA